MEKEQESRVKQLEEILLRKERRILQLERQIAAITAQNENLKKYLDLFLKHPAYKVFKGLKKLLGRSSNDNPKDDVAYGTYQLIREPKLEEWNQQRAVSREWNVRPKLAIVTAVYNPEVSVFRETAVSILNQSYENWTWHVVDASTNPVIWEYLKELSNEDERIKPARLQKNEGISKNLNQALSNVSEDFALIVDHDDTIARHALYAIAEAILKHPDADFIYSDMDKLDEFGRRCDVLMKPDWSPEAMLSINLMAHLAVFRTTWLKTIGNFDSTMDGAQDWDFYLRLCEKTDRIYHIADVLYHWRKSRKSTAESIQNKPKIHEAQGRAIQNHLRRTGLVDPQVRFDPAHPIYHAHPICTWKIPEPRKVSIIIPSLDLVEVLGRCLKGLFKLTNYPDYEVIVVDTGSVLRETWQAYEKFKENPRFKLVQYQEPFNFGKACNLGARSSTGELLLFLNNDTEILHADWIQAMAQWFERKNIGIVGAKLLYPNLTIQHAGVIVGMGGLAAHVYSGERENVVDIFGSDGWYRNYSAVTGACMMISRKLFDELHGFDENFQLNWSDVELCLQARRLGYRIVYTPHARLIHHESLTHKKRIPRADFERATVLFEQELKNGDPYFNCNLSYGIAIPKFLFSEDETPLGTNASMMQRLPIKEIITLPDDLDPHLVDAVVSES